MRTQTIEHLLTTEAIAPSGTACLTQALSAPRSTAAIIPMNRGLNRLRDIEHRGKLSHPSAAWSSCITTTISLPVSQRLIHKPTEMLSMLR